MAPAVTVAWADDLEVRERPEFGSLVMTPRWSADLGNRVISRRGFDIPTESSTARSALDRFTT